MLLTPFLRRLSIRDKARGLIPLEPNWAQADLVTYVEDCLRDEVPIRAVVLKARQLGVSTVIEGLMFTASFLFNGNKGMVVSHEQRSYEHLLSMTKLFWETFPFRSLYTTDYKSRKEIAWNETGSSIVTSTAKSVESGRSQTIHWLHASEVAFWDNPSTLMTGLRQAIPNTPTSAIFLESTANGVGNYFHTTWQEAISGENEFRPFFFPWWQHYEYTAEWARLPTDVTFKADADERLLRVLFRTHGLSDSQIKSRLLWRRWAIRNLAEGDLLRFQQEYPASADEAFVATGRNVFPHAALQAVFAPMRGSRGFLTLQDGTGRWTESPEGNWAIFKKPSSDRDYGRYLVAGDPTHTTRGDYACIQVLNRRTLEQVAVARIRTDPITFASDLFATARFYNDALIVTETTGPGYSTIGALIAMGYPHLYRAHWADKTQGSMADSWGFQTNVQRKHWAIGALLKHIVDQAVTVHDRQTYAELINYVTLDNGGYGAPAGQNDDTVMALAIGVLANMTEPPLPPEGAQIPEGAARFAETFRGPDAPFDIEELLETT